MLGRGLLFSNKPPHCGFGCWSGRRFQYSPESLSAATGLAYAFAEAARKEATVKSIAAQALRGARVGWKGEGSNVVLENFKKALALPAHAKDDAAAMAYLAGEVGLSNLSQHVAAVALGLFVYTKADAYRAAVLATNLGGDTDSFAAIAAGLSALHKGENFPRSIKRRLRMNGIDFKDYARQLLEISSFD